MTWNQACSFAGTSSSYLAVPHSSSLNITGSFTLEAWINPTNTASPPFQIILQKRAASVDGYTLYLSNGKVAIRTGASTRLVGSIVIPNNQWSHIAGLYDSPTNTFTIYVNGSYDTSNNVSGAAPIANTDSVLIGKGSNSPFAGKLDEIRIWNKNIEADIIDFTNLSLGTNTGIYTGLVLSLTFQNSNPVGTPFSLLDWSGNNNNAVNKGASAFNMSNEPSNTISINECAELDGNGDYLVAADHPAVSPTLGITMEVWLYPRSFNSNSNILSPVIYKGNASGTVTDYGISISSTRLEFKINDQPVLSLSSSSSIIPLNQWTHLAITYNGITGFIQIFQNGLPLWDDSNLVGNVHDNTDSLYIGGTPSQQCFDGYIDEVRITSTDLPYGDLGNHVFTSVNSFNDPPGTNVVYNLDGGLFSNTFSGPRLNFRGNSKFSHNSTNDNKPVSPLDFSSSQNFQNGFYISDPRRRIPASGTNGFMNSDTLDIPLNAIISDVNVFVALNHTNEANLIATLISPSGTSVTLYSTSSLINNSDNIVTLFDDQADSSLGSNKYIMFAPTIKPLTSLNSALTGANTSGKWKLKIQDAVAGDTGTLYAWGIQFNNQTSRKKILSLTSLIQGFYNPSTNLMIPDTMRVYLRGIYSPYSILDSSKALLNSSGNASFIFNNINDGVPFIIELKHRNSIETWTRPPTFFTIVFGNFFSPLTSFFSFDFTVQQSRAFGNNEILVDSTPVKFAIYSGDVNQDGTVDLSDIISIYNDATNFASGYINTDLNGDNSADLSDIIIAYNNSINFVSKITP